MFFGGDSELKVELGHLNREVDKLFDKRVEKLSVKASRISDEINQAKLEFISACEEFDRITTEPDLENERWLNPHFIKSEKTIYIVTLRRIFDEKVDISGSTHYARYSSELSSIDSLIREMVKVNSRYKAVIYAYPNKFERFKRAQMRIEKLAASLKFELDRVKTEFSEYNEINGHLVTISEHSDELAASEKWLGQLESDASKKSVEKENMTDAESILASKRNELSAINRKREEISSKTISLIMPLSQAARMYDHYSLKKRKISDIVAHPIEELGSEGVFDEFIGLLEDLKGAVGSKKIEVKKPDETLAQISKIKGTDIYEMLSALKLIEKEAQSTEAEIRFFERSLNDKKAERGAHETRLNAMNDMKNKIESLKSSLTREKNETEQLVMKYYKKRLVIIA
jgi:hypothetical protein